MRLYYRYEFLRLLKDEKGVNSQFLLDILGRNDYNLINRWLNGFVPINTESLIKICNYFNISPSVFVTNHDNSIIYNPSDEDREDNSDDMRLSYNKSFLMDFMKENGLKKKDLLEAFGKNDYNTVNAWLSGKQPVYICAMLRFCNYYHIPMDGFFLNNGKRFSISPLYVVDAQITPTDNYGVNNGRNTTVETYVENAPETSELQKSVRRKYQQKYSYLDQCMNSSQGEIVNSKLTEDSMSLNKYKEAMSQLTAKHRSEMEELRKKYEKQLDEKDQTIAYLEKRIASITDEKHRVLDKLLEPGQTLTKTDLSAEEKKKLYEIFISHGATQAWAYDRCFKEGFREWEIIGIDRLKKNFLVEHKTELWPGEDIDDSFLEEILKNKGKFYRVIGMSFGLKKVLLNKMKKLGMGANSIIKKFSSDEWRVYECEGICAILEEF